MIKVVYLNTATNEKQESLFQTEAELQAHQAAFPSMYNNAYIEIIPAVYNVVPEQVIPGKDAVLDENGNVIEEAIPEQVIPEVRTLVTEEQQVPHENTMLVTIEDITADVVKQKNISKYLKRIEFGQILMAELAAMNKAMLDAGQITSDQILGLRQALAPIKDFVLEGSLGFALSALNDDSALPLALKNHFTARIIQYLEGEQ